MSRIVEIFSDDWVRGLVATLLALTIIVGFLFGIVPFDFFKDICIMTLTYFFAKRSDSRLLQEEVKKQVEKTNK